MIKLTDRQQELRVKLGRLAITLEQLIGIIKEQLDIYNKQWTTPSEHDDKRTLDIITASARACYGLIYAIKGDHNETMKELSRLTDWTLDEVHEFTNPKVKS